MPTTFVTDPNTELTELGLITQAPKALAAAGITTIGNLLNKTRAQIAALDGMGASRMADIDAMLKRHELAFHGNPGGRGIIMTCRDCPTCPQCGNPRATQARAVAIGIDGRYKHLGFQQNPTCDGCDAHHRSLFEKAVAA